MYGSVNDRMRAMDHERPARSLIISADAIDYEVRRALSLGS